MMLVFGAIALLSGCNSSSSGSSASDDEAEQEASAQQETSPLEAYAAKGPFKEGSDILFFELNSSTGLRQGSAVAETQVGELGRYTPPELSGRWIEAEIEGDFFDEYDGVFTEDLELEITAIFDTEEGGEGRNINLFTHLVAARAQQLLSEGAVQSLEDAYSDALQNLKEDFNLNYPPEDLHPFYTADMARSRLDDYATLLIASGVISRRIDDSDQFEAFVAGYATERMESGNVQVEQMVAALQEGGPLYLNRALRHLNELQEDNGVSTADRLSLGWILSGCAAAQAFNVDTVVCLDDTRSTHTFSIPPGEGDFIKELYYLPSQAGMWSVEVSHDAACRTLWTTETLVGTPLEGSGSGWFNSNSFERLVATTRLNPRMYYFRVRIDREDCSAEETELNFRRVADGRDGAHHRGNIFLQRELTHQGVVGAFQNTSSVLENSSNRSYYYYVAPSTEGTYRLKLDYSASSSSAMHIEIRRQTMTGEFAPISTELIPQDSTKKEIREFDTVAGTTYRFEIRNTSPSTSSVGASNSYRQMPFDLTLTRQ